MDIQVIKRSGAKEKFDLDKIHKILAWATEDLNDVSISDIEMNAELNLYDNIPTSEIHNILIKSSNDLISASNPDYQYVAARLLNFSLRKQVWGDSDPPRLYDHLVKMTDLGVYDKEILEKYSQSEILKLGKLIKHKRDENFTYAGLQQMVDKYLCKNRMTGEIYETPQFAYMLIAMTGFINEESDRVKKVHAFYDYISTFKISLPTPIIAGVRTPLRQYASCALFDCGDSLDSIFATVSAVGYYSAKRAGIGLNIGRIRPINSFIRGGEVIHTGVVPYLKVFESVVKSTQQNGLRGASATCHLPFWHYEIEDVIVLKNNAGTDDNRVRKLDYSIQFSGLFYQRVIDNKEITLFSPHECEDLYEAFGKPEFDALYEEKEKDKSVKIKKTIKARDLMELFIRERLETGRIYLMNMDHANNHSAFINKINMSNLCQEILQPTQPLKSIDDNEGEIGTCILAAVNMDAVFQDDLYKVGSILVRFLDNLIDYQTYPVKAAENFTKNRRSLGIGLTNFAGHLANKKIIYGSPESINLLHDYAENLQYALLKSSCELAEERGACSKFNETTYNEDILPIDRYVKHLDTLVPETSIGLDKWNELRNQIKQFGLRHSTLTAQMPVESSSVVQNATNGLEPVRNVVVYKKSKQGVLKQLCPHVSKYKYYIKAWDIKSNKCISELMGVAQKWMDMAISTNHYYNYDHYEGNNIPLSVMIKDVIYAYKCGLKTLYYCNTPDGSESNEQTSLSGCESGACTL